MNRFIYSILLISSFATWNIGFAFEIPFQVKERAGITRANDTVIYGIPFAKSSNITSIDKLGVIDQEAVFTVLSRYGGAVTNSTKPIRMVLVGFQDSYAANQTKTYTLSNNATGPSTGTNIAIDQPEYIEISTGSAVYQISKTKGNIFDFVSVGGKTILSSPPDDGFFVELNNTLYSSGNAIPLVVIEENNPIYCVIKVTGEFKDRGNKSAIPAPLTDDAGNIYTPDSPLRYTLRYYAYKNKSYVRLFATLRNENNGWAMKVTDTYEPIHNAYIGQAYLKTTLTALAQQKTVEFAGFSADYTQGDYSIYQDEISPTTSTSHDWEYKFNSGSNIAGKYLGGASLKDSSAGLFIADRWFWQQFPNQLSISDNSIMANFWPDKGKPVRILGGSWKTHEMIYYFHPGDNDFSDELAFLRQRPVIYCPEDYYANTNFMWGMLPANLDIGKDVTFPAGESLQAAFDRQAKAHRGVFDSNYLDSGLSVTDHMSQKTIKFDLNADPMTYFNWYGWQEFGAMPRAANFGYHNQHYDYSFTALSGFLRFNDNTEFEMGEILVNNLNDILTVHDPDATGTNGSYDIYYSGGQRYEFDALFSYYDKHQSSQNAGPRGMSHFWTKGMVLQYLLTGDGRFKDSLSQTWQHVETVKDLVWHTGNETRHQWRGIDALVAGYVIHGDKTKLLTAYKMFVDNLLAREGGGCIDSFAPSTCNNDGKSGWIQSWSTAPFFVNFGYDQWGVEFSLKLYLTLQEAGLLAEAETVNLFLGRWAQWVKNIVFSSGTYSFGQYSIDKTTYTPYSGPKYVDPTTGKADETKGIIWDSQYSLVYADLMIFRFKQTGVIEWKILADNLFKDWYFYNATTGLQATRRSEWPVIGWNENPASGQWKLPKSIYNPSYYMQNYFSPKLIIKSINQP